MAVKAVAGKKIRWAFARGGSIPPARTTLISRLRLAHRTVAGDCSSGLMRPNGSRGLRNMMAIRCCHPGQFYPNRDLARDPWIGLLPLHSRGSLEGTKRGSCRSFDEENANWNGWVCGPWRLTGIENEIAASGHWNDQGLIGRIRPELAVPICRPQGPSLPESADRED